MTRMKSAALGPNLPQPQRLALLSLLVAVVYGFLWPAVTGDMRHYLVPWLDTILTRGQISAFAEPFSNYTPPYLYLLAMVSPLAGLLGKISLIKALSVGATLLLVLAVRHLLKVSGCSRNVEMAIWVALLPSVAVNAAGFGQCDAIWSAACVMAVASAISRKSLAMLVWFGVAIAFKAQAIFLAPFIAQRLLSERTSPALWPVPGLVYVAAMLPAALAGWPMSDLMTIYLRQAEWNPQFISNAANLWAAVQYGAPTAGLDWLWLGFAAAGAASILFVIAFRRVEGTPTNLVALALLSAMLLPFLLPKMHERFFFLADALALAFLALRRDRLGWAVFLLVETASAAALIGVLYRLPLPPVLGGVMMLAGILILARSLLYGSQVEQEYEPLPLGRLDLA
jgi:Gpi18-like mannosyltransferase